MTNAYGHKFHINFGEVDGGAWFEALSDLTHEDLSYGYNKLMRTSSEEERHTHVSWPPNVKEFRTYCMRVYADYGLPTASAAFKEMENNRYTTRQAWSHPLVFLAVLELNALVRDERIDLLYKDFVAHYENLCSRYMHGERIVVSDGVLTSCYYRKLQHLKISDACDVKTIQYSDGN